MTPSSAKAKGRSLQQFVREALLRKFPTLQPDDVRSTAMGQSGEDVQLSPAARELIPYQIECKNKARSQIHTYYEQAKSHGDHEPLVVVKADRKLALVTLSLSAFLDLLKRANNKNAD